jgi:hypothetical protein
MESLNAANFSPPSLWKSSAGGRPPQLSDQRALYETAQYEFGERLPVSRDGMKSDNSTTEQAASATCGSVLRICRTLDHMFSAE